ncbi:MAG: DUF4258 domain-containing protein [Myxococcota bacterium]|nr:DUF4258 domain-containing protein [Myxococcota bacterium]
MIFRVHALRRMFQRRITVDDVRRALAGADVVEDYPDDLPYPSRLVLGWSGRRALHVVVAGNAEAAQEIVITAYEPEPERWESGFRRRRT